MTSLLHSALYAELSAPAASFVAPVPVLPCAVLPDAMLLFALAEARGLDAGALACMDQDARCDHARWAGVPAPHPQTWELAVECALRAWEAK